VLIFLTF